MYTMVATRTDIVFAVSTVIKSTHVEDWSIALNGPKTYCEVFEGHFGLQIMHWI